MHHCFECVAVLHHRFKILARPLADIGWMWRKVTNPQIQNSQECVIAQINNDVVITY